MQRSEAHERDRQRLRWVLGIGKKWRNALRWTSKHRGVWMDSHHQMSLKLRAVRRLRDALEVERDELRRQLEAESVVSSCLRDERDELEVRVALLTRAAGELFEDMMSRHPEIRDTGFRCQYMGNLYEAVQCLNADAIDVLKERDELQRRLEEARGLCKEAQNWTISKECALALHSLAAALNQQDVANKGAGVGISGKELPEEEE